MTKVRAELFPASPSVPADRIRFVCISDTHTKHRDIDLPDADILIHSGDFTFNGRRAEVKEFADWIRSLSKFKYKIVIAGNHDFTFDVNWYQKKGRVFHERAMETLTPFEERVQGYFQKTSGHLLFAPGPLEDAPEVKALLDNSEMREKHGVYYLEDSGVTIAKRSADRSLAIEPFRSPSEGQDHRVNVWGTPWAPDFHGWAFMYPRDTGELAAKYAMVPPGVDILISHSPPMNILDRSAMTNENVGCKALKALIEKRSAAGDPFAVNVFGHIHESFGTESSDHTLFINAAMSEQAYKTSGRKPPVFDL